MAQTIAGALVGGALGAYGKKPVIPDLVKVDPLDSAKQALDINQAVLPQAEALASDVNAFNQDELSKMLERALPGGSAAITRNISDALAGRLSDAELAQLQRGSAEWGAGHGVGGSPFAYGKDLLSKMGTAYQRTQEGFATAQRWLSQATAPLADVSRAFLSPQQLLSFNVSERDMSYQNQLLKNQVAAAPDPNMVQLAQGFDNFFQTWSSIGTGMLGGMGGGGGGTPPKDPPYLVTQPSSRFGGGGNTDLGYADPSTNVPPKGINFGGTAYA